MSNQNSYKKVKIEITGGFLILAAGMYVFMGAGIFAAVFAAALAHELGHIAVLTAFGCGADVLRFEYCGLCIESGGLCGHCGISDAKSRFRTAVTALAGPAAGLVFGLLTAGEAGRVSFMLSLFNLLPYSKLDGGKFFACILPGHENAETAADCAVILALLTAGIKNPRAAAAGFWLLIDFVRNLL